MDINVIENKKARFEFELVGANSTVCNAIRKELWNDEKVKAAGFNIHHPLVGEPKLIVETTGKAAKDSVLDAIARVKKDIKKVSKDFAKAK